MSLLFVCLANSYKHNNRCLAGVLVKRSNHGFELIQDNWGHPVWFRPINRWTDAGAIPNEEAVEINLFDVIEVEESDSCPDGAQQENYYYSSLSRAGYMKPDITLLNHIAKTNRKVLFGNAYSSVSHDYYARLDYSVLMIHATDVHCYLKPRTDKQPQPRMTFSFNGNEYDFPITDPNFRHLLEEDEDEANAASDYYLTLSLGTICEDKHFKLVAGVIPCGQSNELDMRDIPISARETYKLYKQGLSISRIAAQKNVKEETIISHLLPFIERGVIAAEQFVPNEHVVRIQQYKRQHPYEDHLKPYFEAFNGEISYINIRIVLASLKNN